MKNKTEQVKLLYDRVLETLSSKEFKHKLQHHTDLDIHEIRVINHSLWILLKDGTYFQVSPHIGRSPWFIPTPYNGLSEPIPRNDED